MDKFLAKKNPIFKQVAEGASAQGGEKADVAYVGFGLSHTDLTVRYRVNGTILQLTLKSMYENARSIVFQ